MRKFMNRIPELMEAKGKRDNKKYAQKDMVEGTGLASAAISRIVNTQHIDHIAYASAYLIAEWLEVNKSANRVRRAVQNIFEQKQTKYPPI